MSLETGYLQLMVILFCGIPGSGKTTIAQNLVGRLEKISKTKLFVSDKLKPPVYKKFFRLIKENRGLYDFLIFDGTFYKKSWREKMKKLAGREKFLLIYIKCSLSVALKRNRKRSPSIPERAIHIIYRQMEIPKRADLTINSGKLSVAESVKRALRLIKSK